MGDGIDTDMETDEDGALMDVRDRPGVLALDSALAQAVLAGVAEIGRASGRERVLPPV